MSAREDGKPWHMAHWRRLALAMAFGLLALTLTACDEGPAEEAGSEAGAAVDNAVEETGDAVEDAGDAVGDAVEDAGDAVEQKTE